MNKLLGFGATGLSIMIAAIVSGFRLRPYLDAGETYTPPTFAIYPALIAIAITVPTVFALRWWQGKADVDIGPVTLTDRQPFIVLGCLFYILVATTFFPYQQPAKPLPSSPPPASPGKYSAPGQPISASLPLFRQNIPVYL
jgi:hypothetical protein